MNSALDSYEELQSQSKPVIDCLEIKNSQTGKQVKYFLQDSILKSRVDNMATLKEGSTTGDAELQDLRVGFDGTVYNNAGECIRTSFSNLSANCGVLASNIIVDKQINEFKFAYAIRKNPLSKNQFNPYEVSYLVYRNYLTGELQSVLRNPLDILNYPNNLVRFIWSTNFIQLPDSPTEEDESTKIAISGCFNANITIFDQEKNYLAGIQIITTKEVQESILGSPEIKKSNNFDDLNFSFVTEKPSANEKSQSNLVLTIPKDSKAKYIVYSSVEGYVMTYPEGVQIEYGGICTKNLSYIVTNEPILGSNALHEDVTIENLIGTSEMIQSTGEEFSSSIFPESYAKYLAHFVNPTQSLFMSIPIEKIAEIKTLPEYLAKMTEDDLKQLDSIIPEYNESDEPEINLSSFTFWTGLHEWESGVELGTEISTDISTYYGSLSIFIKYIQKMMPSCLFIFVIPWYTEYWGEDESIPKSETNSKGLKFSDYAEAVINQCEFYGVPYIDLLKESGINSLNIHSFSKDGRMLNTIGSKRIASIIASHLKKYFII